MGAIGEYLLPALGAAGELRSPECWSGEHGVYVEAECDGAGWTVDVSLANGRMFVRYARDPRVPEEAGEPLVQAMEGVVGS
jgi:hypothetical protein